MLPPNASSGDDPWRLRDDLASSVHIGEPEDDEGGVSP